MTASPDPLQTGGALISESHGAMARAGRVWDQAPHPISAARKQYRRQVKRSPDIRMVTGTIRNEGRRLHFAVSNNESAHGPDGVDSPPIWAINIHGYFAGGGMYWRESARLAEQLGWRVINPSLPGFGGSDPLDWSNISVAELAQQVSLIADHVGAGPAVLLGHSMGGAVAIDYANAHPRRTLGVIYRDGIATPAWKERHGVIPTLFSSVAPDAAPFADMVVAVLLDLPDLFIGRMYSTVRSVLPDMRRNVRTMGRTLPVGSMLMSIDLRPEIRGLAAQNIPLLTEWGCFDRVANSATAHEFARISKAPVQWVPGGHSWMLARPQGQVDVLQQLKLGQEFVTQMEERWRRFDARDRSVRAFG